MRPGRVHESLTQPLRGAKEVFCSSSACASGVTRIRLRAVGRHRSGGGAKATPASISGGKFAEPAFALDGNAAGTEAAKTDAVSRRPPLTSRPDPFRVEPARLSLAITESSPVERLRRGSRRSRRRHIDDRVADAEHVEAGIGHG